MELILNDFSICGQFADMDAVDDYIIGTLKKVFDIITEKKIAVSKKTDTFARHLTKTMTVSDYLKMSNHPAATLIKRCIIEMAYGEPHWDKEDVLRSNSQTVYGYQYQAKEPNCFTEAIERECPLLSFPTQSFCEKKIFCTKNGQDIMIDNILNLKDLLDTYLKNNPEEITYLMGKYPFDKEVVLCTIGNQCFTEQALSENNLTFADKKKILTHIANLIEDKSAGKKTHWWSPIDKEILEYRVTVSDNREFRLFFLWKKSIIFLNGFIKKTQETPESEKKKARQIVKKYTAD